MPDVIALPLAIALLVTTLGAAVAGPPVRAEVVAAAAALLLVVTGAVAPGDAVLAAQHLVPTVVLLAALLVLADGAGRAGLFAAVGGVIARRADDDPRRLLGLVVVAAASVTALLSLDATVVLLTPVVIATAVRARADPEPHAYACAHLANSASLLLPVSNLTNLLAFRASGLGFTRFGLLMALPTVAVVAVEWCVLRGCFAGELRRARHGARDANGSPVPLPRRAAAVVAGTLAGFALAGAIGVAPVWVAVAGAVVLVGPGVWRRELSASDVVRAADLGFAVFVLGLGVVVAAASTAGLGSVVAAVAPQGDGLFDLVVLAALAAVLANLVNNLPATLLLLPVVTSAGPVAVLAVLIGVNVGPNLTYAGSLATLLWRRVLHGAGLAVDARRFVGVGARTVPAGLLAATGALWLSAMLVGAG